MRLKRAVISILSIIISIAIILQENSSGGLKPEGHNKESSAGSAAVSTEAAAIEDIINKQSEDYSMRWFYSDSPEELRGVALVIHGLNLRPDRMLPIISKLNESGIDALRLSLRGHGDNYSGGNGGDEDKARMDAFKKASYQMWLSEAYWAYLKLKDRGEAKGVPLFLTAFSIGGLIGLDMFASIAEVKFDKLLLFAPAIRLRAMIYLERILSPFPRLVIPSMADKTYLANEKGTPISAYNALFDGLDQFNQNAGQKLNVPTLVFIDKQDEFIPLGKLEKLVTEKKWTQWQFFVVEKDQSAADDHFYHHIIDASSTGNTVWREMMAAAVAHLNNEK